MNSITETKDKSTQTKEECLAEARSILSNESIKSSTAGFCWRDDYTYSIFTVNAGLSLDVIVTELISCIGQVKRVLTNRRKSCTQSDHVSFDSSELDLICTRLEQAEGLITSIANTLENIN